jgi:hypothetical protein
MCGPADFGALHISLARLAALFAGGVTTYVVYKIVSLCRERRPERDTHMEVTHNPLRALPVRTSGEHSNS